MMDEYIKRNDVYDALNYEQCEICDNIISCSSCSIDDLFKAIKHIPAADVVEVRHGEWIEWRPNITAICLTGDTVLYACSKCTAKYTSVSNYCPECGAKMDGGGDGNG